MNKKATRYFSNKHEKSVAKAVGGKKTANSGAPMFVAGDVYTDSWLLECKTKMKPSESITIHREWLEKNEEEAFSMQKEHSALVFNFGDIHYPKNYYIISEDEFKRFLELERGVNYDTEGSC